MEYQKTNLLDNILHQPSNFRTKKWVEINDDACGTYNKNSQIKFKTLMLKSSLCDYSDACILVNGTTTVKEAGANNDTKRLDERNKRVIFKNCAPFTDCISKTNNTQIDNAKNLDVMMLIYNLIEYSHNYTKTSGSLWQYYRDNPNDNILNSESFKFQISIIRI